MSSTINADTTNGVVVTSDTSGEIELQSNGVTKAKVTANGLQDASGSAITSQAGKNLIINGNMQIAQRGTSASVSGTGFTYDTVDRWKYSRVAIQLVTSLSQSTDVPTGEGFSNSWKLDVTTAETAIDAGDYARLQYAIEGQMLQHLKYGTSSAESITLSFWVKSSKTGNYNITLYRDEATDRMNVNNVITISSANTWEKKTITLSGDTSASITNDNGGRFILLLWLNAGSNFTSSTTSGWQNFNLSKYASGHTATWGTSTSDDFYITGVQLEVGTEATPFENRMYSTELAMCQRYYERTGTGANFGSNLCVAQNTTRANCACAFPVSKRASPTISVYSSTGVNTVVAPGVSSVTVTVDSHNVYGIQFLGGAFVANRPYIFYYIADSEL